MSKILVTGGAGFIGSHIVDLLIDKGHQVVVIDNLRTGKKANVNKKAEFIKLDVLSKNLEKVFKKEKFDLVCHTAAQINLRLSLKDPIFDAENNIIASLNLLENCVKYKVKKIVFSSTGGALYGEADVIPTPEEHLVQSVLPYRIACISAQKNKHNKISFSLSTGALYGDIEVEPTHEEPISPYGIAKLSIENYLYYYYKVHGLKYVALRYANVYGPRQDPLGEAGVIAVFTNQLLKGEKSAINGDGKQTRDYVFVKDVATANLMALENKNIGSYNVGTGIETSVNELFNKLNQISGKGIKAKHNPAIPGEQKRSALNCSKINNEFGWQIQTDLDQGLNETVDWFKENV